MRTLNASRRWTASFGRTSPALMDYATMWVRKVSGQKLLAQLASSAAVPPFPDH